MNTARRARSWALWNSRRAITVTALLALVLAVGVGVVSGTADNYSASADKAAAAQEKANPTPKPSEEPGSLAGAMREQRKNPTPKPTPVPTVAGEQGEDYIEVDQIPAAVAPAVVDAARAFTEQWLAGRTTTDPPAWQAAIAQTTIPELAPFIAATDTTSIPEATITSITPDLGATTFTSGAATVALSDASALLVRADLTTTGWKIADYQPGLPPAAPDATTAPGAAS